MSSNVPMNDSGFWRRALMVITAFLVLVVLSGTALVLFGDALV